MTDAPTPEHAPRRYGTFAGVFTPTLLTILGVIMYLRVGWVVGNAGLLGGWLIMAIAIGITAATGLSLSSVATNTRIGAGGPYAVIRKSLGLEVGGSVGVPLYLSQAIAVAMYIFGMREGWQWIFPSHPAIVVDLVIFAAVAGIGWVSAGLAFRIQYGVMAVIGLSLVLIVAGGTGAVPRSEQVGLWGTWPGAPETGFRGTDFWAVFAVFFPAATGITVGSNMSGELENPRRNIPLGTLSAIGLSSVVYFALAWWVSRLAPESELVDNYTVLVDNALWGPGVLLGLLGATFSSALSAFVGAPRILAAVARDGVIPGARPLGELASDGEPRRATAVTAVIVLLALMLRDLNAIAPLVTMFFLITYSVINVVVLTESRLGLISYRPTMRVPGWVPLLGAIGCVFVMFVVNPTFSMVAGAVVMVLYVWIMSRGIEHHSEDVRSGVFGALAEWAARKVTALDVVNIRAWKPNLLVPVRDPTTVRGAFKLLASLTHPEGSIKLLGIATEGAEDLESRIRNLAKAMSRQSGVFTTWSVVDAVGFTPGVVASIQALGSAFFRPNILVLEVPPDATYDDDVRNVVREARRLGIGVLLLAPHERAGLGRMEVIHVWFHPQDPSLNVEEAFRHSNLNLALLTAYRLAQSWEADLNLITVVEEDAQVEDARRYLEDVRELARLPRRTQAVVMVGKLEECVGSVPQSDMDIFGLALEPDLHLVRKMVAATRSACIFTADSGKESAFA